MTQERIVQYEQQYQNLLRQQHITEQQQQLIQKQFQRDSTLNAAGIISPEEIEVLIAPISGKITKVLKESIQI